MPKPRTLQYLLACAGLCAIAGCVQPGSLDDKQEFQRLLGLSDGPGADGGAPTAGSSGGSGNSGGGTGGSATAGSGGAAGSASAGCAEACELIAMRCATAGCHAASMPAGGLDLASAGIATRLSNMPATTTACNGETLLDTSAPEDSLLYGKLLDPPACGSRMPLGLPLATDEIACILSWLSEGAQCGGAQPGADAGMDAGNEPADPPDAGMPPAGGSIWIEAEMNDELTAPLEVASEGMASGGEYIVAPTDTMLTARADPGSATDGIASYGFNVGTAGDYKIWGRVLIPGTENDSFWVRVDDGTWYQWNNISAGTSWHWDDVHDSGNADMTVTFDLTAGQHTLDVSYREVGAELDKILITSDADYVPMGEGQ